MNAHLFILFKLLVNYYILVLPELIVLRLVMDVGEHIIRLYISLIQFL